MKYRLVVIKIPKRKKNVENLINRIRPYIGNLMRPHFESRIHDPAAMGQGGEIFGLKTQQKRLKIPYYETPKGHWQRT